MSLAEDAKPIMDLIEQKQNCPLCQHSAKFIGIEHGRKKKFSCLNCKVFVISPATEKDLSKLSRKQKDELSKKSSQCDNKTILLIWLAEDTKEITSKCEPESNWR